MSENFLDTLKTIPNHFARIVMTCPARAGASEPVSGNRSPDAAPPMSEGKPYCSRIPNPEIRNFELVERFNLNTMLLASCTLILC